jgi:hypothetical protein
LTNRHATAQVHFMEPVSPQPLFETVYSLAKKGEAVSVAVNIADHRAFILPTLAMTATCPFTVQLFPSFDVSVRCAIFYKEKNPAAPNFESLPDHLQMAPPSTRACVSRRDISQRTFPSVPGGFTRALLCSDLSARCARDEIA